MSNITAFLSEKRVSLFFGFNFITSHYAPYSAGGEYANNQLSSSNLYSLQYQEISPSY